MEDRKNMRDKRKHWTVHETEYLARHFRVLRVEAIAQALGRSARSVERKAYEGMKLRAKPNREEWYRLFRENPGQKAMFYANKMMTCVETARARMREFSSMT